MRRGAPPDQGELAVERLVDDPLGAIDDGHRGTVQSLRCNEGSDNPVDRVESNTGTFRGQPVTPGRLRSPARGRDRQERKDRRRHRSATRPHHGEVRPSQW